MKMKQKAKKYYSWDSDIKNKQQKRKEDEYRNSNVKWSRKQNSTA